MKIPLLVGVVFTFVAASIASAQQTVTAQGGIHVRLDESSGQYTVNAGDWTFSGTWAGGVADAATRSGSDDLGAYEEIAFHARSTTGLAGSIRAYTGRPAVLFSVMAEKAPGQDALPAFPDFGDAPASLHRFSYRENSFGSPTFTAQQNGTPWLLFDDTGRAAIVSPAANFMIARMSGTGTRIACGLNPGVHDLPAGFTQRSLVVFAPGINAAWTAWGDAVTTLAHRHRPANDADAGLRYLGYWTDNGADYYYDYDRQLGYAGTLEALVKRYHEEQIPIRYLQLDSWWYYKTLTDPNGKTGKPKKENLPHEEWNRYGGLIKYEAHPTVFPEGLKAFQEHVGLPLITHNRWIDPESPYHQRYRISGVAAIDPQWWRDIMDSISAAGVVCYEQDWLSTIYEHSPDLQTTPSAGPAFMDGMAHAAQARGMTLQYCMPFPRHFLQGAAYDNLTTIRVSGDRFNRPKWDNFLYTSRLASALGIWPWTDVFKSSETDNLLIATLSAGMVGTGDKLGAENRDNLLRAARADGVLVKPDAALVPLDQVYLAEAISTKPPMVAATHTDHGARRTAYVFCYDRTANSEGAAFTPAAVGVNRECYVYDYAHGTAKRQGANDRVSVGLAPNESAYYIVAPVSAAGIAVVGDAGKFVAAGRKRIAAIDEAADKVTVKVLFAAGETSVRLFGFASGAPAVTATAGEVSAPTYDSSTGRFEVTVSPGSVEHAEAGGDRVREAVLVVSPR